MCSFHLEKWYNIEISLYISFDNCCKYFHKVPRFLEYNHTVKIASVGSWLIQFNAGITLSS
ncbi:hypothetical protein MICAG_120006 [Microcystis aeruginosa PCC 9808]|uniref:Uncharacterized protein n=1 Tax=Microcystis aeruginosa PCC 9808 TaxID=1160284 RepID=I4HG53_MICAE|nr:hypothetical protein MICAG_120006 [Microcystis aeruginosa PCC 9808]